MRHLCISFTSSCFCSSRRGSKQFEAWGQGVKNFRTGGLPIWAGGIFCWRGQYPITCHVFIVSHSTPTSFLFGFLVHFYY